MNAWTCNDCGLDFVDAEDEPTCPGCASDNIIEGEGEPMSFERSLWLAAGPNDRDAWRDRDWD